MHHGGERLTLRAHPVAGRGQVGGFPGIVTASLSQIGRGRCLHVVGPRTDPQEES